jgi:hypothetical protein
MQQYDICNHLKTKFRLHGIKNKKETKYIEKKMVFPSKSSSSSSHELFIILQKKLNVFPLLT